MSSQLLYSNNINNIFTKNQSNDNNENIKQHITNIYNHSDSDSEIDIDREEIEHQNQNINNHNIQIREHVINLCNFIIGNIIIVIIIIYL